MFRYYFRTVIVSYRVYGFGRVFLSCLLVEPLLAVFNRSALLLDEVFFRRYRSIEIRNPIFIIGHPRSGTTFLHKLLTATGEAAVFKTWHIFFPALTARLVMKPLIRRLVQRGKDVITPESTGHRIALDEVEEEEMLFLHINDTQFTILGILGFDEREYPELIYHDAQPHARRIRSMRFLNGCFQRHCLYTGHSQIIAQMHFSTMRLKTIKEYYPDAKIVFVMRNPHQVVPSFFSLLHKSIEYRWGIDKIPEEVLDRYNRRRYRSMITLYKYFHDLHQNGELGNNILVIPYTALVDDLDGIFEQIAAFTEMNVSEALRGKVAEKADAQKHYKRSHSNIELGRFGITHEMIARDFSFIFNTYHMNPDDYGRTATQ